MKSRVAGLLLALCGSAVLASAALATTGKFGTYSGRSGDALSYAVRGSVFKYNGHKVIWPQVVDKCHQFTDFDHTTPIERNAKDDSAFAASTDVASISGHWATPTKIRGKVKTPCASRQVYVMRMGGGGR